MNTLAFIDPQEIMVIILIVVGLFIFLPVFIIYKVIKHSRNKRNSNA